MKTETTDHRDILPDGPIDLPALAGPIALLISDREAAALAGVSRSIRLVLRDAQGGYRTLGRSRRRKSPI
jgi:hypothetical protein